MDKYKKLIKKLDKIDFDSRLIKEEEKEYFKLKYIKEFEKEAQKEIIKDLIETIKNNSPSDELDEIKIYLNELLDTLR